MSGSVARLLPFALGLAVVVMAACGGSGTSAARPPDLLLVSLDTLRADHLGSYGYARDTSPFLDGLAARGTRFARCIAPAPHTAPSHMSAFTGLDPAAHGVINARADAARVTRVSDRAPLLAEQLARAGYFNALVSEGGNVRPEMGFGRGFHARGFALAPIDYKLDEVSAVLDQAAPDRPLFLFFHTYLVHSPYVPPAPFFGRFTDPDYRGVFRARYDKLASAPLLTQWGEAAGFLDTDSAPTEADLAFLVGLYDEGIQHADHQVERLFARWSARRDAANTLFAVFSDHGEEFFEHGRLGHRWGLFGPLVHVPLIVVGPGIPAGRVVPQTASLSALGATLLDALGLDPTPLASAGVLPLVRAAPSAAPAFGQSGPFKGNGRVELVEAGDRRLLRTWGTGVARVGLFDPAADPFDRVDLASAEPERANALIALLDERLVLNLDRATVLPPALRGELDPNAARELAALGYTGD